MSQKLNNQASVNDLSNLLGQAVEVRDWERKNGILKSVWDKQELERNKKFQAMKVGQLIWENDVQVDNEGADIAWKIVGNVPSNNVEYKGSISAVVAFIVNDDGEHTSNWNFLEAGDPTFFGIDALQMKTSKLNKIYWKYIKENGER